MAPTLVAGKLIVLTSETHIVFDDTYGVKE